MQANPQSSQNEAEESSGESWLNANLENGSSSSSHFSHVPLLKIRDTNPAGLANHLGIPLTFLGKPTLSRPSEPPDVHGDGLMLRSSI